jgi:multiple sugar transport system permease protein
MIKAERVIGRVGKILLVSLGVIFAAGPIVFTIVLSLQNSTQANAYPPDWIFRPTLSNYGTALSGSFGSGLVHSVIIDVAATIFALVIALPSAYFLTRYSQRSPKGRLAVGYSLATRALPGILVLIPLFEVFRILNLINTYTGMVIAYQVLALPIAFSVMLAFYADIPVDIFQAAEVDGAGQLEVFWRIALPLVRAGVLAAAVLSFLFCWTDLFFALMLTGDQTVTAPVEILGFVKYVGVDWGALAAGSVVLMVPSVIFGIVGRRALVKGLTAGALGAQ